MNQSKLCDAWSIAKQRENIEKAAFQIENITVTKPPLLKVYYWESMDIDGLNNKLKSDSANIEHDINMPAAIVNTRPLKIELWLRNVGSNIISLSLKRIKSCECKLKQTQVGFNQFRYLYHCPHRRLVNILQEKIIMESNELVAMTITCYYFLFGKTSLTYAMTCSDSRVIHWNFNINVIAFDPIECVLTRELLPIGIKEYQREIQTIWIHNKTVQMVHFMYKSNTRGLRLLNPNLVVPPQSVWPLIIEYRPSDFENKMELNTTFNGIRYKTSITCDGILEPLPTTVTVPNWDYECAEFLYVIYPNKLTFTTESSEVRYQLVAIHNYDQKCIKFKWQMYSLNRIFIVNFEPAVFTLKPHHTTFCLINVRTFNRRINIKRVPIILEVHRILDKSTQIAQQLLTEIESIDDPKWAFTSYKEHIFLQLDVKVNVTKTERFEIPEELMRGYKLLAFPNIVPNEKYSSNRKGGSDGEKQIFVEARTTIFEKLFWDYLSRSSLMRNTAKIPTNLGYYEVTNGILRRSHKFKERNLDKSTLLGIISRILAHSCHELSKNYAFVPQVYLDS